MIQARCWISSIFVSTSTLPREWQTKTLFSVKTNCWWTLHPAPVDVVSCKYPTNHSDLTCVDHPNFLAKWNCPSTVAKNELRVRLHKFADRSSWQTTIGSVIACVSFCFKLSTKMLINVENWYRANGLVERLRWFFEVEDVQMLSSQTVSISHEKSLVVTHHLFSSLWLPFQVSLKWWQKTRGCYLDSPRFYDQQE